MMTYKIYKIHKSIHFYILYKHVFSLMINYKIYKIHKIIFYVFLFMSYTKMYLAWDDL